jgi:hydrogenase maturation factor
MAISRLDEAEANEVFTYLKQIDQANTAQDLSA